MIPIEVFARDLWEALRSEVREQLDSAVTEDQFTAQLPPWDELSDGARESKILIARDELLKVLDRAGYQVRKKKSQ
jgi:hypothetical protein